MKSRNPFKSLILASGLGALMVVPVVAQEYSRARVVRLSFVEGNVTIQRPDVPDWAEAPVNTPIQEGFKLATAENAFAEGEFENGSTVRAGQLSLLEFTQLALTPSGGKVNRLALQQGYATVHAIPGSNDVYEVSTPIGLVAPRNKALFRVDLDQGAGRVEVFYGTVEVSNDTGSWSLGRNDVLELRPGSEQPYSLTQGINQDAWDQWVNDRENSQQAASAGNAPSPGLYSNNVSDLLYGWNDLSNYGAWSYLPGWGYGWVPSAGPGWAPYSLGRWCWYPGFGWVWISTEPWGWLPYHYGGWDYIGGVGWAWFPDNFASFSPAQVTWYSGPGWVGWVPRSPTTPARPRATPIRCPSGQVCGTAVSAATFQSGGAITPSNRLNLDPTQGQQVNQNGISPTRAATLPGPTVTNPFGRMPVPVPSGKPGTGNAGAGRASAAPNSPVVFDPSGNRYVNNPAGRVPPRPVQPSSPVGSTPQAETSGTQGTAAMGAPSSSVSTGRAAPSPFATTDQGPSMGAPRPVRAPDAGKPAPARPERFGGETSGARMGPSGGGESPARTGGAGGDFAGSARSAGGFGGGGSSSSGGHGGGGGSSSGGHPH